MSDPDFDDLNPPLAPERGTFVPCLIVWAFLLWGAVAFVRWIF